MSISKQKSNQKAPDVNSIFIRFKVRQSKILEADIRTTLVLNRNEFVAVCAKYGHDVDLMTASKIF